MRIIRRYIDFIKENVEISGDTVQTDNIQSDNVQTNVIPTDTQSTQIIDNSALIAKKVNKIIDYTSIKPGLLKEDIKNIVTESLTNGYYGICVNPEFVDYVVYEIEDNDIKVISTLDFPDGKMDLNEKITELLKIISDGADEVDMSIDIEEFKKAYVDDDDERKQQTYKKLEDEISDVAEECHKNGIVLKIIIECGILSFDELEDICKILSNANVDFVQTSSGIKGNGIEIEKIKELRRLLPEYIKIKVAGGVRTIDDANNLYPLCDRIGTSVNLK